MSSRPAILAAAQPISVRGARVHNLKNVDIDIPANELVVVTGVSGSGKSSLVFDTLYAEGQRRYVESLSAYARQFLERMDKPDVDDVQGVSPAIAIQRRVPPRSSRSTVGTMTEVLDYLRLLFARAGITICPSCGEIVGKDTPTSASQRMLSELEGRRAILTFPTRLAAGARQRGGILRDLLKAGFRRALIDGEIVDWGPRSIKEVAEQFQPGDLAIVTDRMRLRQRARERLLDSLEIALREGGGTMSVYIEPEGEMSATELRFDDRFRCSQCDVDFLQPEPRLFSFNSPYGACPDCKGFGNTIEIDLDKVIPDPTLSLEAGVIEPWTKPSRERWRNRLRKFCDSQGIPFDVPWVDLTSVQRSAVIDGGSNFSGVRGFFERIRKRSHKMHLRILLARYRGYVVCPTCQGSRVRWEAHAVQVGGLSLPQVAAMTIGDAAIFFEQLQIEPHRAKIVAKVMDEIRTRLSYLVEVGLTYITLDRLTGTLSGGEAQRISLATCLGSSLVGSMYVLDEPSVGLHARDNARLIRILSSLRDLGNSVLVVEHDRHMIEAADHVIDLGPGAGVHGGEVVFGGRPKQLAAAEVSITGAYLRGKRRVPSPAQRRAPRGELTIVGARENNLQGIDVRIPLGLLCCVTGVSGSGKSTLIHDILYRGLMQRLGEAKGTVGDHDYVRGAGLVRRAYLVDQSPIGRSHRSNSITYIKAFDAIRACFARTREARARGFGPGHFSFNVPGGRCEVCQGNGEIEIEMQFLSDVTLPCEECGGTRFQRQVLEVTYKDHSIHEVLQLTVSEARRFFADVPKVADALKVLEDVGLGYLQLGQPSSTLSGGEAQRVKLAAHLLRGSGKSRRGALFLFDEPTTGLHFDDIAKLLYALNRLIDAGASVIVIEHNLEFIAAADWIIDLGPEGGDEGGQVVTTGTPEEVAEVTESHTGHYLAEVLEQV